MNKAPWWTHSWLQTSDQSFEAAEGTSATEQRGCNPKKVHNTDHYCLLETVYLPAVEDICLCSCLCLRCWLPNAMLARFIDFSLSPHTDSSVNIVTW